MSNLDSVIEFCEERMDTINPPEIEQKTWSIWQHKQFKPWGSLLLVSVSNHFWRIL